MIISFKIATPVKTIGGINILPDMTLKALQPAHSVMLVLTGGAGWEDGSHDAAGRESQGVSAHGVSTVAAICGATATGASWHLG